MPVPTEVDSIDRNLVREEVYTMLLGWIVDGVLLPGERVRDYDLARRLGTSRMPVREALRRLEDEGLVEAAANRWTRVALLDENEAQNILPILSSLETLAMRLAGPNLTKADRETMAKANTALEKALQEDDATTAADSDTMFHAVFVRSSRNPDLMRFVRQLRLKLQRLDRIQFDSRLLGAEDIIEHQRILSEMDEGNYHAAAALVQSHWRKCQARMNNPRVRPAETADAG